MQTNNRKLNLTSQYVASSPADIRKKFFLQYTELHSCLGAP